MNTQPPKFLFITYYFPPIKAIACLRNYNLAIHIQRLFSTPTVLTTANRTLLPKEELNYPSDQIVPLPTYDYRTFSHSPKSAGTSINPNDGKGWMRRLKETFPFNLFLDLGGPLYIYFGYRKGKEMVRTKGITHLFSSYSPYADHIIAYLLKKKFPYLYWNADFNNLHVEPDSGKVYWKGLQEWFNKKVLAKANMVTTVSETLVPHLKPFNRNVKTLENGIFNLKKAKKSIFEKFTISYTGSLYPQQSPRPLFKTIKNLLKNKIISSDDFQIIYAGTSGELWDMWIKEFNLESLSVNKRLVPLETARELQHSAHLNLLLSWTTPLHKGIIPAKFYDYLFTKRPMLLLMEGGRDIYWEEKLRELEWGKLIYNKGHNKDELEHWMVQFFNNWHNKTMAKQRPNQEKLKEYFFGNRVESWMFDLGLLDKTS